MAKRRRTNWYPVDGVRYDMDRAQSEKRRYAVDNPNHRFRVAGTSSLGWHVEMAAFNRADALASADGITWH